MTDSLPDAPPGSLPGPRPGALPDSLADLVQAALAWQAQDPDPQTRAEIDRMVREQDEAALRSCFGERLGFGTAGIRGARGPGPGRLNRLVARQVAAGVGRALLDEGQGATERGVVIGYDGRHGSREYAEDSAAVLGAMGLPVWLSDSVVPTPILAHATTFLGCAAGIMVTASHNPPQDNGIKVYWGHGGQITAPLDTRISERITQAAQGTVPVADLVGLRKAGKLQSIPPTQLQAYLQAVLALRVHPMQGARAVYTAMHGVGWDTLSQVLAAAGHAQPICVPEQRDPDGDFPTVKLPNPEEKGALDLAFALASAHGVDLILANDPDADRLAVAIPDGKGGWRRLSGDQVGLLLAEDLLAHRAPTGGAGQPLVATTIVSSSMLRDVATAHGAACAEVLTGFKWLARAALAWDGPFVLGFEEALGYSVGEVVHDKDGISAALIMLDLASWLKAQGRSLADALDELARTYGVVLSAQKSLVLPGSEGQARIRSLMDALRADPPRKIGGLAVAFLRDVREGTRQDLQTGEVQPLHLPSSDVLAFDLAGGGRVLVRPSGTEPKLKLYFEARSPVGEGEALATARARAAERLAALRQDMETRLGI